MCVQMSVECTSDSKRIWVELWVEAIFFIYMDSYIVYLFYFCFFALSLFFWGGGCGSRNNFLHLLYSFYFRPQFSSWRWTVHAAILRKTNPSPKPVTDTSMPKVMYIVWSSSGDLFPSVFFIDSVFLALSERSADWVQSGRSSLKKQGCILHRPQSCAFFYAIEHKERK